MDTVESVFAQRMRVMGIVNVTPDSFSDGGRFTDVNAAVQHGQYLIACGADVVDVGGESTRPGAAPVDAETETARVLPVIEALAASSKVPISIDTTKSEVARRALEAGARIVNDVGLRRSDQDLAGAASAADAGYIVMHSRQSPSDMQHHPHYDDLVSEVCEEIEEGLRGVFAAGVAPTRVMVDLGLGFAKDARHNVELLARIDEVSARLTLPVLVGASRKSFLNVMLDSEPMPGGATRSPVERDAATTGTTVWAFAHGAAMVRVHNVVGAVAARQILEEVA
ncbi:MAG: dihydropteroate synthase [Acidimicrobiia bacterium]